MKLRPYNKIICLDFDGVINVYKGWRNEGFAVILDNSPVKGVKAAIKKLRKQHLVIVHSTRCAHPGGKRAIINWLLKHGIQVDKVSHNKPLADVYVDDRGVAFDGNWRKTLKQIENYENWYSKRKGVGNVT